MKNIKSTDYIGVLPLRQYYINETYLLAIFLTICKIFGHY